MRFLADECCDFAAVRALRADGHDVLAVGEFQHRSVDKDLLELALNEDRVLLTEDKDFGWLVFAGRNDSPGVILIRFQASQRNLLPASVSDLFAILLISWRGLLLYSGRVLSVLVPDPVGGR